MAPTRLAGTTLFRSNSNLSTPYTVTHAGGTNPTLALLILAYTSSRAIQTPTYASVPMTLAGTVVNGTTKLSVWYLASPVSGNATVYVQFAGTGRSSLRGEIQTFSDSAASVSISPFSGILDDSGMIGATFSMQAARASDSISYGATVIGTMGIDDSAYNNSPNLEYEGVYFSSTAVFYTGCAYQTSGTLSDFSFGFLSAYGTAAAYIALITEVAGLNLGSPNSVTIHTVNIRITHYDPHYTTSEHTISYLPVKTLTLNIRVPQYKILTGNIKLTIRAARDFIYCKTREAETFESINRGFNFVVGEKQFTQTATDRIFEYTFNNQLRKRYE